MNDVGRGWIRLTAQEYCQGKCKQTGWDQRESEPKYWFTKAAECEITHERPKYIGWLDCEPIQSWFTELNQAKRAIEQCLIPSISTASTD